MSDNSSDLLTFGGHLDVLRKLLIRVVTVVSVLSAVVFIFKYFTFKLLLAPGQWDFITYRMISHAMGYLGFDIAFGEFHVNLIATDLSSQFMTHIATSLYLGLLFASPFIVFELYRFVAPALLDNERRYSVPIVLTVYLLFAIGVLMSYFILFPISFRFLGTYSVAPDVVSMITLDSYISTFVTLTLLMGLVFQLPVLAYILARLGFIRSGFMKAYRRHALIIILFLAAVITPPDVMTLLLVAMPLYLLYEISIHVVRRLEKSL